MRQTNELIALAVLSTSLGCAGAFDDLADQATGDSISQPEPSNGGLSDTFPHQLEAVSGEEGNRAFRFVASGLNPPSLTTVEYSLDGSVVASSLVIDDRAPVTGEFVIATAAEAQGADGLIAVSNNSPIISVYRVGSGTTGPEFALELRANQCSDGMNLGPIGEHMVLAQTNAGADANGDTSPEVELIASAGPNLVLFQDINLITGAANCFSCKLDLSMKPHTVNSMAEIEVDTLEESAIVVALRDRSPNPDVGGESRFDVFNADQIRADNDGNCFQGPSIINNVRGPTATFGTSIAVGDFDGDDIDDVAFGNPEESEVFVFPRLGRDPTDMMPLPMPTKLEPFGEDVNFGRSLVAADIGDGDDDELLVADSEAERDGVTRAGFVYVFDGEGRLNDLADSTPETDQRYGTALTSVKFPVGNEESVDLAIVGADQEIFTYFALEDAADPRP